MDATALDIIVLILVLGAGALGAWRGFVTEALSLFAWAAAIMALKFVHGPVSAVLGGFVDSEAGAAILAFVLVFGIVFVASRLVARALGRRVRQSVLGPIDRLLGFGFGALKGLIGATLLFLLAVLGHEIVDGGGAPRPAWMVDARTYPLLNASGRALVDFVEARQRGEPDANAKAARSEDSRKSENR